MNPRIKNVTAHPVRYPEPHDNNNLRCITLARVETEDGAVGWGECISQVPESALAVKIIIEQGYAPLLVGEDPRDVERLWHKMLGRIWWYGPQGIAAFGVSAVDMALWDLKGKLLGLPVCNLLGGKLHAKIPAMASVVLDMEDMKQTEKEFAWFRGQGYRMVKGGWGKNPEALFGQDRKRDIEVARCIRGVIGDETELVFDVMASLLRWDLSTAIERLRDLEPFCLTWIEEPLPPHDLKALAQLRRVTGTRIGTGEQEWNVEGYRRLIESGGVDVVQMDPGRCLGITGCRHVIKLVEAANLRFSAHTWSSAINTAASIHLCANSTHGFGMDFKPHESPMQHELVSDPWIQKGGDIEVRDTPGLGVNVLPNIVQKFQFA